MVSNFGPVYTYIIYIYLYTYTIYEIYNTGVKIHLYLDNIVDLGELVSERGWTEHFEIATTFNIS